MATERAKTISLKAYAKINLALDILGMRPDGYHEVRMIMQQVSLCDEVTLTWMPARDGQSSGGITLTSNHPTLPLGSANLAYRAAALMMAQFHLKGALHIELQKNIPVAAGLAGGSTDAAAVIKGISELVAPAIELSEQMALSARLGADVPFCLLGGTALARGTGTVLTPIRSSLKGWIVLVTPDIEVSTPEMYAAFDEGLRRGHRPQRPDIQMLRSALSHPEHTGIDAEMQGYREMGNVFEPIVSERYPEIREIKRRLLAQGAQVAMMSGSGPTVFGFFEAYETALCAQKSLSEQYRHCHLATAITA